MRLHAPFIVALAFVSAPFAAPFAGTAGSGCQGALDGPGVVQHIFEKADLDQDGRLSAAEYEAAHLEGYGVSFDQSDLDGDGSTSMGEYLELYMRHHPDPGGIEA